jgi:phosphate/phosphite/phosphonate ABC transporter binding protein
MLSLDEVIGKGGFGTVYRGTMRSPDGLTRRVAVKVLSEAMSQDERAVGRFRDEARLLALIDHPGLVPVYALERIEQNWAVIMGFVDGFELFEASQKIRLPASAVREVGIQVADVLAAMWAHPHPDTGKPLHVVHRDIKPHNIMVQQDGRVRLLDLGIASAQFESRESKTQGGEVSGTMAYMSPDRWARRNDGHAGDVYALGAMLFQLAADARPSWAGSDRETHERQLELMSGQVRDAGLFGIIERCLSWTADDRPTAAEVAIALRKMAVPAGLTLAEWVSAVNDGGQLDASYEERMRSLDAMQGTFDLSDASYLDPKVSTPAAPARSRRTAWVVGGALVAAVLVAGTVSLAWMGRPAPVTGEPLEVLLTPTVDKKTLLDDNEHLRLYLESALARPVVFEVGESYGDTSERFLRGEADFAMMPHRIGMETWDRNPAVTPLVTKVVNGSTTVEGYLVIRSDDPVTQLNRLMGSTLCYSDPKSNTGYLLPRRHILANGLDPDGDFEGHVSGDHEQVLRDVLSGVCRVGATFSGNYVTADQRGIAVAQLKVLALTGSVPHDSLWAREGSDADLVDAVTAALVRLDPKADLNVDLIGDSERMSGFSPVVFSRPSESP